jgi:cytochrome c2
MESVAEGAFAVRYLALPTNNPQKRSVRPADIGFLSSGEAILPTIDGDVWRVTGLDTALAQWTRIATGLAEPMDVEIGPRDEIYVFGREGITELIDANHDGHTEVFRMVSDAFHQSLHSRDHATSFALGRDECFYITRPGQANTPKTPDREIGDHRGTVARIFPDGRLEILAEGLRVPYLGLDKKQDIWVSDQQGHWTPSTPLHRLRVSAAGEKIPFLGYVHAAQTRTDMRAPALYFPYQVNRSAGGFATVSAEAMPDLPEGFMHLSWSGRLFGVAAPSGAAPFAWRLPIQLNFPALKAATHPQSKKLYVVGLGISAYLHTTEHDRGLAEVQQARSMVAPISVNLKPDQTEIKFAKPLPEEVTEASLSPLLRFWALKRSSEYGSGHFRWDGEPGEHVLTPSKVEIAPDRQRVHLHTSKIFQADVGCVLLSVAGVDLELYTSPKHLPPAGPEEILAMRAVPAAPVGEMLPGDAKVGQALFARYACIGCHSLQGQKLVGPPLSGIPQRHGDKTEAYLRESIYEPAKVVPEGYEAAMPSFQGVVTEQDVRHLIEYIKGL